MGSSARKKTDKKKDFQKPKLKVGKAKPKASNFTDTSFRSKGITVKEQSIKIAAPSSSAHLSHYLSLLSSRSDSTRRESLNHISSTLAARPVDLRSSLIGGDFLAKLLPLMLDRNDGVRSQLLTTLKCLRPEEIHGRTEKILLFIRAGMTHIAAGIKNSTMDVLAWALQSSGDELVSSPGGWAKMIKLFALILGWSTEDVRGTSCTQPVSKHTFDDTKFVVKILSNLDAYLAAGLAEQPFPEDFNMRLITFPLSHVALHMRPRVPNAYAYLSLHGPPQNWEDEMYTNRIDRQAIFNKYLQSTIGNGLATMKRQGGDVGRAAAKAESTLSASMADFSSTTFA